MSWQQVLKTNFTNVEKLADFLQLDETHRKKLLSNSKFVLNLPLRLANKIKKNCIDDPLFKQFVPLQKEKEEKPGFALDPVEDQSFQRGSKLLHKYNSRALVLTTSACAMHCRYCFRQNFPYETKVKGYEIELEYLQKHKEIEEVILSGGDPLSLTDEKLNDLITEIEKIPHVKRLRFHSRFVIGIPERITDAFLKILEETRLQVWFVIHSNHSKELDQDVLDALKKIQKLGIPVLNQWILLKGVNDTFAVQKELCEKLIDHGIFPYYMHKLDKVKGTSHFEVDDAIGKNMIADLQENISGYGVPKFVTEVPFEKGKRFM